MRAELQTLGKAGARFLNGYKGIRNGAGIWGVAFTGVDAYQKRQWQNHHTADVLIDASLFGADIYYESHYKESELHIR